MHQASGGGEWVFIEMNKSGLILLWIVSSFSSKEIKKGNGFEKSQIQINEKEWFEFCSFLPAVFIDLNAYFFYFNH
jgi:hypothetical protein